MSEKLLNLKYEIGGVYNLKFNGDYYKVTLISINKEVNPILARVLIREHSIESFTNGTRLRKRHTKKSEVVPCTEVPLNDLW